MIRACNRWQFGDHTMPEFISMDRNVKLFHFHKKLSGHIKNQLQKISEVLKFLNFFKIYDFLKCVGNKHINVYECGYRDRSNAIPFIYVICGQNSIL